MKKTNIKKLLNNNLVIEEINKYLWLESQKVGYSIGIERATEEWIQFHAQNWIKHYKLKKEFN